MRNAHFPSYTARSVACVSSGYPTRSFLRVVSATLTVNSTRSSSSRCHSPLVVCPARSLSQQAGRWLDKLRYGAEDAPSLGSWETAYENNAMDTRKLYCKALVHASGGSRLARDWIAGSAALTSPDPSLIYTALQHTATAQDVEELREHFLSRLLARETPQRGRANSSSSSSRLEGRGGVEGSEEEGGEGSSQGATAGYGMRRWGNSSSSSSDNSNHHDDDEREVLREGEEAAQSTSTHGETSAHGSDGDDSDEAAQDRSSEGEAQGNSCGDDGAAGAPPTPNAIREAELLILSQAPEVRCFMYDAMTASLFHSSTDLRAVESARRHTFWIGANVFGISFDELTALWRVVEAELLLKKEKTKVLGQPWSE